MHEGVCNSNDKIIWLNVYQENKNICVTWNSSFDTRDFTLYIAPFPELYPVYSINLSNVREICGSIKTTISIALAVYSEGSFSNVEYVILKGK